jgi:hypothetical protein
LLPTDLPRLSDPCQLPIPFEVNFLLASAEHVLQRDVTDGTVQTDVVVMFDVCVNQMPRIV